MSLFVHSVRGHGESVAQGGQSSTSEREYLVELHRSAEGSDTPVHGWVTESALKATRSGKQLIQQYHEGAFTVPEDVADAVVIQEYLKECGDELTMDGLNIKCFVRDPHDARRLSVIISPNACSAMDDVPQPLRYAGKRKRSGSRKGSPTASGKSPPPSTTNAAPPTPPVAVVATECVPDVLISADSFQRAYPKLLLAHLLTHVEWDY